MRAYIIVLALCCAACGGPEFTLTQEPAQLVIPLPQSESEGGEFGEGGQVTNVDGSVDSSYVDSGSDASASDGNGSMADGDNDARGLDGASLDSGMFDSSDGGGVSCLRNTALDLGCETYFPGMLRGYTCTPDNYVGPGCAVRADNNPGDRCCQ
jgi:hypothetical protein